jgi:hypothetical protein
MHHRNTRALAAAALALTLGACMDAPTSPAAARIAGQPGRTVSASGITLIPNTVKYRDNGGKPATGRSGSAELEALALLSKDGTVTVQSRARSIDPAVTGLGQVSKLQIKASSADGTPKLVRNLNGDPSAEPLQMRGLVRGDRVQLQANVRGLDGNRTDVVTVTETVKRRPDLTVQMDMARQVPAGQPVPITATVREQNGDMGAFAECTLLVNGWYVDGAPGVWVDAGDAVACAFTHSFAPGDHDVQVEVGVAQPADWDVSNNRSEVVRVEAVGGSTAFAYTAVVRAEKWRMHSLNADRWHNPALQSHGETVWEDEQVGTREYASMSGSIERGFPGAYDVEISQTTGGRVVHADAWTAPDQGCEWRLSGGVDFWMCSFNIGEIANTFFTYTHNAVSVTYHSRNYYHEWDEGTGEETYYYHYVGEDRSEEGALFGLGDDYAFMVKMSSGNVVLTADSRFALQHYTNSYANSACEPYADGWDGLTGEWCASVDGEIEEWFGYDQSDG